MIEASRCHRRTWLRRCAGAAAAAWQHWPRQTALADAPKFPAGRFVDVHTHLGQVWTLSAELKPEELLSWMDERDIAQAVVLPLVSPESSSFLLTSEFVLDVTKPHRDRLIPFCCVDPRTSFGGGKQVIVNMLKRYVDAGARGFGEHKAGIKIDSSANMNIFAACAELKLPVLFHLDGVRNMDQPGLPGLDKVLAAFPDLTFIGHGPGWWASISGDATLASLNGYPNGPITPNGAIDVLMDRHANLYGDLSAGSGAKAFQRDMKFAREFVLRRADRLMFGSDYLAPRQDVPQFKVLEELNLPDDVQAKVFRDNARRLILTA